MRVALANLDMSLTRIEDILVQIHSESTTLDARVRSRHETQQSASCVLLCGYLETFLRQVVEAFFRDVQLSGATFMSLPEKLRNHHFEAGAILLGVVSKEGRNTSG